MKSKPLPKKTFDPNWNDLRKALETPSNRYVFVIVDSKNELISAHIDALTAVEKLKINENWIMRAVVIGS